MQYGVDYFTSQSTLILNPKIMLNLELVCNTLNRIFGVVLVILNENYVYQIITFLTSIGRVP
jgi:hypothetical protein